MEKDEIREKIWRMMVEKKVALPPFPVHGRIPNFKGAREAAMRLRNLDEYRKAEVLLCNPDSPQIHVREMALKDGKILVVATPRLSRGFIEVRGQDISPTIRGMIERGKPVKPGDHKIDIFVAGSVAVSVEGYRLGKGTGYSDAEFRMWREAGSIDDRTLRVTTVHDIQVVEFVPRDEWDVPVDLISTPTRIIWTKLSKKL